MVADKNTRIEIAPLEMDSDAGGDGLSVKLNFGMTFVKVSVTSPDGTRTVCYEIQVFRDRCPFPVLNAMKTKFECGICLNVSHCAVNVDGAYYCQLCFQVVTRVNKRNPSTNQILHTDQINQSEEGTEQEISVLGTSCICGEKVPLGQVLQHVMKDCPKKMVKDEKTGVVHVNDSKVSKTLKTYFYGLLFLFIRTKAKKNKNRIRSKEFYCFYCFIFDRSIRFG